MFTFFNNLILTPDQGLVGVYTFKIPTLTIGNISSFNLVCEQNPTHLLCGTSVAVGHALLQQLPGALTIRPCAVFLASPHCCSQFCLPAGGGTCDAATGACFCNPGGIPDVCQMIKTQDDNIGSDDQVLEICKTKCALNPNGCTKAAAATDGIVGTVCMCYCDS